MRLVKSLLAAFCVLSISASPAAAAVWKHNGANLNKFAEIGLSGLEAFGQQGFQGTIDCEVSATLTTTGGSTAKITKYTLFACAGTGDFSQCVPLATEAKGLPWTVDVNASDLTVTNMRIRRTFVKDIGCPITETDITWSPTFTLDSTSAIYEMEFFVQGTTFVSAGALWVDSPNGGTYGIG